MKKKLPFASKVRLVTSCEPILDNFISVVRDITQHGDEIQFFDKEDSSDWDEDRNEDKYVLDVFVKRLNKI
ncbi:MAG TPA: hypothetical protein VJ201_05945 [Candidatus Babeliales bacterium]|nr:hypothetical protein [Candidatus Babeliales bacterium]HLC06813.1 hypothetical protein [Candidatus Babeliales bacterium]